MTWQRGVLGASDDTASHRFLEDAIFLFASPNVHLLRPLGVYLLCLSVLGNELQGCDVPSFLSLLVKPSPFPHLQCELLIGPTVNWFPVAAPIPLEGLKSGVSPCA